MNATRSPSMNTSSTSSRANSPVSGPHPANACSTRSTIASGRTSVSARPAWAAV